MTTRVTDDQRLMCQNTRALDFDFNFDALGGLGQVGSHTVQQIETHEPPQTRRIIEPERTIGRWFSKLLDRITPETWRIQGRYDRALEDYSAQAGKVMGRLSLLTHVGKGTKEYSDQMDALRGDLVKLREEAYQLMRMGFDYKDIAMARISRNIAILTNNGTVTSRELYHLKFGDLLPSLINEFTNPDQPQPEMAEDLQFLKDALDAIIRNQAEAINAPLQAEGTAEVTAPEESETPPPPQSRYTEHSIGEQIFKNLAFTSSAREALANKETLLSQLTGDARAYLEHALDAVEFMNETIGMESGLNEELLNAALENVEEGMNQAITCAVELVENNALPFLDTSRVIGNVQQIEYNDVVKEILAFHEAQDINERPIQITPESIGKPVGQLNQIQIAIRGAQKSIGEISELYGKLTNAVKELKEKSEIQRLCLIVKDLADNGSTHLPEGVPPEEFCEACDEIIGILLSGVPKESTPEAWTKLVNWMGKDGIPDDMKEIFGKAKNQIACHISKFEKEVLTYLETGVLPTVESAGASLDRLNRQTLHKIINDVGALLQQSGIPSAEALHAQALRVSQSVSAGKELTQIQAELSRLMTNMALATMQMRTPVIRSSQPDVRVSQENQDKATSALRLLETCMNELCAFFPEGSPERTDLVQTLKEAEQLNAAAKATAKAFAALQKNKIFKESKVAEQVAVVMESCNNDADSMLLEMMNDAKWKSDDDKLTAGRNAVYSLLNALVPLRAKYGKDAIIHHFNVRWNPPQKPETEEAAPKKGIMRIFAAMKKIVEQTDTDMDAHDIYLGFDNKFHVLINTDRQFRSNQALNMDNIANS